MSPNQEKACQILRDQAIALERIRHYLNLLEKWVPYLVKVADHRQLGDIRLIARQCSSDVMKLEDDTHALEMSMTLVAEPLPLLYGPPDVLGNMEMDDPPPYDPHGCGWL